MSMVGDCVEKKLRPIDGNSKFEFTYSLFILLFGFGILACFIIAIVFMVYIFNITFLIFFWPILVGIWIGVFRKQQTGYETELKENDRKKLNSIIETICKRTGQKKPHQIIITEGTGVAVTGFFTKKIIIGMVALKFMNEEDILAILAHEYGHFANKDTLLGYLTYRIQNFIEIQKEINRQNIGASYTLIVYLPTWLFFYVLSKYYSLISLWYSRRVEFRADDFASGLVGEQKFVDALVKYCIVTDIFDEVVPQYVTHYLKQGKRIVNLYEYIKPVYSEENMRRALHTVLSAKSSWWSTHPSISERLEMLNIKKVNLSFDSELKPILENQESYETQASEIMTQKMAYWLRLVALSQGGYQVEG